MPSSLEPLHLSLLLDFPGHRSYQPAHRLGRSAGRFILPRSSLNSRQLGVGEWINISASSAFVWTVVKSRFYPISRKGPDRIEFQVPAVVTYSYKSKLLYGFLPFLPPFLTPSIFPWIICQTSYLHPGLQVRVGFGWKSKQDVQFSIDPARVWNQVPLSRKAVARARAVHVDGEEGARGRGCPKLNSILAWGWEYLRK